jgi:heme/copper-type cytochrome/quinol oxidase subunit 2
MDTQHILQLSGISNPAILIFLLAFIAILPVIFVLRYFRFSFNAASNQSRENYSTENKNFTIDTIILAVLALLVGSYIVVRYQGLWIEGDTSSMTRAMESISLDAESWLYLSSWF